MQELSRQAPQHPKKATMKMITPANKTNKNKLWKSEDRFL
jgi:hypothetical protein